MPVAALAPDGVETILDGREPSGLSLRKLTGNLPLMWEEQKAMFGFEGNCDANIARTPGESLSHE